MGELPLLRVRPCMARAALVCAPDSMSGSVDAGVVYCRACADAACMRCAGTACLDHLDLSAARHLDVSKPLPPRSPAAQPPQASSQPPQKASAAAAALPRPSTLASVPEASLGPDGSEATPLVDAASSSGAVSASSGGSGRASPYELVEAPLKRPQAL